MFQTKLMRTIQCAVLAAALWGVSASAQELRGRVQGTVSDVSGAVIPAADVTLRNVNTNVATNRQTNEVGQYVFDFVLPGAYELTIEVEGFRTYIQENILVQTRADITVNAAMEIGAVAETVTVEEAPVAVSFNSTTMETTIDTKMSSELPIIHRNPFLLATLDPAVNYRGGQENSPYHHWAASQMDVGGNTQYKNNVLLDGVPQLVGAKGTYVPAMDAVSEVNVQQNAVDAEYGHSAGGILSVQMKSGTNDWHGTAYYFGRNPAVNARPNPLTAQKSVTRRNVWGVTSGNPIIKNKVFNYFAYEGQNTREPRSTALTLPTSAEINGDFSNSLNGSGGLRTIYDPFTTVITGSNTSTRDQFVNNMIPQSRLDPTSRTVVSKLWQPNGPGDNASGRNNFRFTYPQQFKYYNISDRVDYNVTDNVKVFYRLSRFKTTQTDPDFTGGSALQPRAGSARNTWQTSGDMVWTINPTTVFNVRGSWSKINDSFDAPEVEIGEEGLAELWPGNNWYASHVRDIPKVYFPNIDVRADSRANLGRSGYWFQVPKTYNWDIKLSKTVGRHYFKFGHQYRAQRIEAARPRGMLFRFDPNETAGTIFSPKTANEGHAWASMMLGTISRNSSRVQTVPVNRPHLDVYGFYLHDDFKINQRVTLNMGVRWEYETGMRDPENRLSRYMDFGAPLQGVIDTMGEFPAEALALRNQPLAINGAWRFTDPDNRYSWNPPKNVFLPRFGVAIRLDNKTALRIGYARYAVPAVQNRDALGILGSTPYPGYTATTNPLGALEGIPRAMLADPFPSSGVNANPLIEPFGKRFGEYAVVGSGEGTFFDQNLKVGMNDRINFTIQRELVSRIVMDATFFMNFGRHHTLSSVPLNIMDPRLGYEHGSTLNDKVDNPFFGVPQEYCPGSLCNTRQVSVGSLLVPYPQYGNITLEGAGIADQRYRSFQLKLQRPFANGFNFLVSYNINKGKNQSFYDNVDAFDQRLTMQKDPDSGQKLNLAGIYELPFGKGRKYGSDLPAAVEHVLGGWSFSGIYSYLSGQLLGFPGALVSGAPTQLSNRQEWFTTSSFEVLPAFTRRANPIYYSGVRGPSFRNIDLTLNKKFDITEKLGLELRMEAYNLTNSFMGRNPNTDPTSGDFGSVTQQLATHTGREFQYSARFIW